MVSACPASPCPPPGLRCSDNPVAFPLCRRTYAQNAPFVSAPHTHIMPHMPHSRRRSRRSRTRGSAAASRLGIGIGERQFDSRQPVRAAGNCRIIFMAFEATATWHATLALASQSHLLFRVYSSFFFFVNPKNNGRESRKVRAGSVCVARCMLHMCAECR